MRPELLSAADLGPTPEPHALASSADERALVAALLQRDRKAAADFVDRYADPIYGYVSRRLAPRADLVDDVVQDVFLVALQKLDTFEGQSSLVGWLIGIARHKVEDVYRAKLREPDPFSHDMADATASGEAHADDVIDAARTQAKIRRILEHLPAAYSAALLWRYWEHRTAKDMAAQKGKSEKAIERVLARARASFKRLWEAS